jgi:2-polyprenyl-6-methoxyphenol hydroxylase-like FAD-dependent oxidoreductase
MMSRRRVQPFDSLKERTVEWTSKLERFEQRLDGELHLNFPHRTESGFDVVVGADGAWSKVRSKLTGQKAMYSGIGGL